MPTRQPVAVRAMAHRDAVAKSLVVRFDLLLLVISLTSTVVLEAGG